MYLVREVFNAKPGKAKDLVKMFKQAIPLMSGDDGMKNMRVMTDAATDYWTVVFEAEVEDMGNFFKELRGSTSSKELQEVMKGYMDLVNGGYREIFIIE